MTSSDSGEDFESADEDFDHPQKLKTDHNSSKLSVVEAEIKPLGSSSESLSTRFLQDLNDLKLESKTVEKHKVDDSISTTPADVDECLTVERTEINRSKLPTKKLGTKLSATPCATDLSFPVKQETAEDIVRRKNNCDDLNELNKTINVDNKTGPTENLVTETVQIAEEITVIPEDAILISSKPGDGWEIEEEDGFEIPVALAKASDGSIQCAKERISELNKVKFKSSEEQQNQGWGGWGGWGVSSLLSTATGSVTTFSSHVTAGLSSVLETTVGAPEPETLAAAIHKQSEESLETKNIEEEQANKEDKMATSWPQNGLGSIVSGVSFLGSTVINRGLDTLETLGKKTMEVLQEGDPGLMKKRAMLFPNQDKPVLSQILREAKEKADHSDKEKEEKEDARKAHFESLFDDFQGMVHLEALEMLSTQCELKLQSQLLGQSGPTLEDLQETLSQVRELCEVPDEEEDTEVLTRDQFAEQVTKCVSSLGVDISAAKIIKVNDEVVTRLENLGSETETAVNQAAISSLAEFTAAGMECFHKSAELLLAKALRNTPDEADNFVQLTCHLCARVSAIANEFTQLLTKSHPIANSSLITNIFLEASNSCSYIRNACQLMVPILQVGAVSS